MPNRKLLVPLIAFMFTLNVVFPFSVFAQDSTAVFPTEESFATPTPEPVIVEPPPPDPVVEEPGDPPATTPENLLGQLFQLLKDGTFIAWGAAGVVLIVGLLKILAQAVGVTVADNAAAILALIVQVLVWLAYSVSNYFGQGETFKAFYLNIVDVIRSLLPLAGLIFGSHVLYTQAAKRNVPILGYYPAAKLIRGGKID